jgi:hypothetical protein
MKTEETYRKLTEHELNVLGINRTVVEQKTPSHKRFRDFVGIYYPKEAALTEVVLSSEYNDNTYDNRIQMVVVYNGSGDELTPNKDTARECRTNMRMLDMGGNYSTNDQMESFFVQMKPKFPDLYVKE